LILDGHGSCVTIEAIKQIIEFVALPLHTSHDLQPLDVSSFKPFKTNFRKERDLAMERNNHVELDKVTLVRWVNKNPKDLLTKKMKLGFRVIRI
jgi:hypothetical protein